MQIRHDPEADAMSIHLMDGVYPYSYTKMITGNFLLDFDADGHLIGIEILNPLKQGIDPAKIDYLDITRQKSNK